MRLQAIPKRRALRFGSVIRIMSDLTNSLITAELLFRNYVGKWVYHVRIHNCLRYLERYSTGKLPTCERDLASFLLVPQQSRGLF